jgi:hypothetical protein
VPARVKEETPLAVWYWAGLELERRMDTGPEIQTGPLLAVCLA